MPEEVAGEVYQVTRDGVVKIELATGAKLDTSVKKVAKYDGGFVGEQYQFSRKGIVRGVPVKVTLDRTGTKIVSFRPA